MKFILIVIVMANNNFEMASEQFATKSACDAAGKQVVIVLSSPYGKQFDPREMAQRDGWGFRVSLPGPVSRQAVDSDSAFIDDRLKEIARRTHASVLDPRDTICSPTACPTLDAHGKPLLKDDSHLRSAFVQ